MSMYTHCLIRPLSSKFLEALRQDDSQPIDVELAKKQHEAYVELLRSLVPIVITVPASDDHPDCCFIEDTAIIIGNKAMINILGAPSRRGEEVATRQALDKFTSLQIGSISPPGTIDGGDVLYTGKHIFVGLSKRTNAAAIEQLSAFFAPIPVHAIEVIQGLHLKSVISAFDSRTIIAADNPAGRRVVELIKQITPDYDFVFVPDEVAANVLRIGNTLVIQDGFPESQKILEDLAAKHNVSVRALQMSEMIKADGALTCCSILFNVPS